NRSIVHTFTTRRTSDLIRNAIDHGIEMPEERERKGKDREGKITLKAYHCGNHVFVEIVDNGAGINKQKVLQKALEKGVVSPQEADRKSTRLNSSHVSIS